jgi:hypothetical protein
MRTKRGPKPQTAITAPATAKGFIRHESIEPTSPLNAVAMAEFRRLAKVLDERGVLDRIDLAYLTGAARTKAALDLAHEQAAEKLDMQAVRAIAMLTTQHRGYLRDMGLPLPPSRSVVHANGRRGSIVRFPDDSIESLIKIRE